MYSRFQFYHKAHKELHHVHKAVPGKITKPDATLCPSSQTVIVYLVKKLCDHCGEKKINTQKYHTHS